MVDEHAGVKNGIMGTDHMVGKDSGICFLEIKRRSLRVDSGQENHTPHYI